MCYILVRIPPQAEPETGFGARQFIGRSNTDEADGVRDGRENVVELIHAVGRLIPPGISNSSTLENQL